MKKIVRLTEGDLHNIIRKTVKKIVKESHGEPDESFALIYDGIIDSYKAQEIADDYNMYSEDEAAAEWFKGVADDGRFEMNKMPLRRDFIMDIPELDAKMYYDYGADYYFLVKNNAQFQAGMANESLVNRVVRESINGLIKEDAGGATNCAGTMQTGSGNAQAGTNPESGQYTVPFGKVQRRKIYQPKEKAGGDVTKQSSNVDMTPAMNRKNGKGGSISIPKRKV